MKYEKTRGRRTDQNTSVSHRAAIVTTPERIQKLEALADAVREWVKLRDEVANEGDEHKWFIINEKLTEAKWRIERALRKVDGI